MQDGRTADRPPQRQAAQWETIAVTMQAGRAEEWRHGWRLVIACFVGFSFFSFMSASIGAFMAPLGREFGWSRTLLSAGITIAAVTTALLSPFFGLLIDRYGSRRVALPGIIATTVAVVLFATANGSPVQWLGLWTFYAIVSISVKTTVWTTAVAGAFRSAQGLALGITLSGTAAAQAVAPPLVTWLVESLGWRSAYLWLGCSWGGLAMVLCLPFLHDARCRPRDIRNATPATDGVTPRQALRSSALHRISLATLLMITVTIGLLIHQIEILTATGLSPLNAAWIASLAGLAGIVGKLATGVLLDRYRATWVGSATLAGTTAGFLLLLTPSQSPTMIALAMVIVGYAAGTALQVGSFLTVQHAGLRNFGTIYGVITSLVALGSGVGPLLAGLAYDLSGSYAPFLAFGAASSLLSGFLIWTLPAAPAWNTPETMPRQSAIDSPERDANKMIST